MKFICLFISVSLISFYSFSQDFSFKNETYIWPTNSPEIQPGKSKFKNEDLVILDEKINFNFISRYEQELEKNCVIKINSTNGINKINNIALPESFDISLDQEIFQQGRFSKFNAPYIYRFKIHHFAARILKKDGSVVNLKPDVKAERIFWLDYNGSHLYDFNYIFDINNLETGDLLEYNYKILFLGRYGYNLFYFNGPIAKEKTSYVIDYYPVKNFETLEIICNTNVDSNNYSKKITYNESYKRNWHRVSYNYSDLPAINYPVNSFPGKNLPHIFVDLNFLSFVGLTSNVANDALISVERGKNFEWPLLKTLYVNEKIYDKQHAYVRKYISKISSADTSKSTNIFLNDLIDSLNSLQFMSAEFMNHKGDAQYAVTSGEWLSKGKLTEEFLYELYWDILQELNYEKNVVCVQDKRLGEIKINKRSEPKYENLIFGITNNKSVVFITPRWSGLKYFLDEIPFYYEGVNAAVLNFDVAGLNTNQSAFKKLKLRYFIKTASSTENENVRVESGVFKINRDTKTIEANLKESLNGQFSTIIRPFYLNEVIDSTINPVYFKKFTDKPGAFNVNIKLNSKSKVFPYKHSFAGFENIKYENDKEIPLKNWFSFTLNQTTTNTLPNFDYYFDFRYSDQYNFMFEFNKATEISNISDFNLLIQNDYYEVNSKMLKQSETNYLLSVSVKIKKESLPKENGQMLLDLASLLNGLNNKSIYIQ